MSQQKTDDADIDVDRFVYQAPIDSCPVVALDRLAEALGNHPCGAELVEIRDQETELVAAKAGMQLLVAALCRGLLGDQVVAADLLAQQPRHAVDDLVANRVA